MSEAKKPFDPRERYAELKAQVAAGGGMTASEWDWFGAHMEAWEPEEFKARRKQADIRIAIADFEKHLAPEGYVLQQPGTDPWQALILEFASAILHGDEEHRDWLMEAALAFTAGEKLPPPRGKDNDEAPSPTASPIPR